MGVIRKHRTASGLIKYQPKGEPADWTAAAKGILATEKPDAIVVMLGINDRVAMREPVAEKKDDKKTKGRQERRAQAGRQARATSPRQNRRLARIRLPSPTTSRPMPRPTMPPTCRRAVDHRAGKKRAPGEQPPRIPRGALGRALQQEDRGTDRRPESPRACRCCGSACPRSAASRAPPTCCSWTRCIATAPARPASPMSMSGTALSTKPAASCKRVPTSKARAASCAPMTACIFTKPGARKLAHYVDREITRLLAGRSGPIALPSEPVAPDPNAAPGQPAPRPMAGPILPLVASSVGTDQLLGGPGSRPAAVDALAARTLVKGEALAPPAGRADDFVWPRREVGREQAKGESPVANVAPDGTAPQRPLTPLQQQQQLQQQLQQQQQQKRRRRGRRCRRSSRRRCAISSAALVPRPRPPLRVRPRRPRPDRASRRRPATCRVRRPPSDARPRCRRRRRVISRDN